VNDYLLLGIIIFSVVVPTTVISIVLIIVFYFNDLAFVFKHDSDNHIYYDRKVKLRRVKKNNQFHLVFFKRFFWNFTLLDKDYKPFSYGKKNMYFLFEDSKGFLHNLNFQADSLKEIYKIKVIPVDVFSAQVSMLQDLNTKYVKRSWWDKNAPLVIGGTIGALFVFALIYQWHEIQIISDKAAAVTDRCFAGCVNLFNSTSQNLTAIKTI